MLLSNLNEEYFDLGFDYQNSPKQIEACIKFVK